MEEMLTNVAGARQIFERWMEWEPDEQAWHSYINMELRYKEVDRARSIYERFVMVHPEVKNWVKFAKFEERQSNTGKFWFEWFANHLIVINCFNPLTSMSDQEGISPYNINTE